MKKIWIYILIFCINISIILTQLFLPDFLGVNLIEKYIFLSILLGLMVLIDFLIFYKYIENENDKVRIENYANYLLHDFLKGKASRSVLFLSCIFSFVLVGLVATNYLVFYVKSEIHTGAFAGAIVGSLFSTVVLYVQKQTDRWKELTPYLFLKQFMYFFYLILGALIAQILLFLFR